MDQYTEEQKNKLVECCPQQVFEFNETGSTVVIRDAQACIFCKECIYTLEDFRRKPEVWSTYCLYLWYISHA